MSAEVFTRTASPTTPPTAFAAFWSAFKENRGAVIGMVVVIAVVLMGVFAGLLTQYSPIEQYRDATLVPRVLTRRGVGLDAEFRYLEPAYNGTLATELLPFDRAANRSRHAVSWLHEGELPRHAFTLVTVVGPTLEMSIL